MNDWDVLFVKHFLVLAAREQGLTDIEATIEKWDWCGPGVWSHIEEAPLVGRADLFKKAVADIKKFGDEIPVSYAKANIQVPEGCQFVGNVPTSRILKGLKGLADLIEDSAGN